MKKSKIRLMSKRIFLGLGLFLIIFILFKLFINFLNFSDFFKIKYIKNDVSILSYLKGKNIFSVNLKEEAKVIERLYPQYRYVRLIRILPNCLYVDFIKREPLAYVKLKDYFYIDEEAVLFDIDTPKEVPIILGLENKISNPASGRKYNIKELNFAIELIKQIKTIRPLNLLKIKELNVEDLRYVTFLIAEDLEVRIGQEEIKDKLQILSNLINQLKNDLANIKYIDLRFKEPTVKLKNVP